MSFKTTKGAGAVWEERGKSEFPVKKNLAGDGRRKPILKKDAGVNVPERRRLLKQYSYFMFSIKTLRDYFWQIVPYG